MPAQKVLRMGDKITHWNGIEMTEEQAGRVVQKKLKDVVTPSDEHTIIIEREIKQWETNSWETSYDTEPKWETNSWG